MILSFVFGFVVGYMVRPRTPPKRESDIDATLEIERREIPLRRVSQEAEMSAATAWDQDR